MSSPDANLERTDAQARLSVFLWCSGSLLFDPESRLIDEWILARLRSPKGQHLSTKIRERDPRPATLLGISPHPRKAFHPDLVVAGSAKPSLVGEQ